MQLRDKFLWYASHLDTLVADGQKAVVVSENSVSELLAKHSSNLLEWLNLEAIAAYELRKAERSLEEILIPEARTLLRTQLQKKGESHSESRLDKEVYLVPIVSQGARQVADLEYIAALFKNVRIALQAQKENLNAISAKQCVELKSYRE